MLEDYPPRARPTAEQPNIGPRRYMKICTYSYVHSCHCARGRCESRDADGCAAETLNTSSVFFPSLFPPHLWLAAGSIRRLATTSRGTNGEMVAGGDVQR